MKQLMVVMLRKADQPQLLRLRLGAVDSELSDRPVCRVFVSEKPSWSQITDDLPRFDTKPTKA